MRSQGTGFRDIFAEPIGGETLRAFLVFSVLVVALLGIGGELAFRDMSLEVLKQRVDLGRNAAQGIADEIAEIGLEGGKTKYSKLWSDPVKRVIQSHMDRLNFIRHVELRDRFGVRVVYVARDSVRDEVRAHLLRSLPGNWPPLDEQIIRMPLQAGTREEGEILLGISSDALQQRVQELRRSLRLQVVVAVLLALGVLVLGLFYVLHLIRKNRNLEQARQSAARASYVGLLASGLAHEIRNPLNAMNMNLQMLEEELHARNGPPEGEQAELLESTKSEIKRLERLVNNFLTYARPAQPRFESKDLNVVAREVLRLLEADFRQHGVELRADLEPLLPQVETDEAQFKQALINLLVNARQVLKNGGVVTVRTRVGSKGEAVLEVEDNGPGIPPDSRERIFEVFYSSRGGGTGLGLPIARQIIERHGGTIDLDSVVGQGTTFRIRLPRHHQRASSPSKPEEAAS